MTSNSKFSSTVHGYPRIGADRELKKALESFWAGRSDSSELLDAARLLRETAWQKMARAGIEQIPSNTFSLYDHIADMIQLVGAVPERHRQSDQLAEYFAMARGTAEVTPLEMTKWFDTNYHYLVPELSHTTSFTISSTKPFDEFEQARALGIDTRPVIVGPITFLALSKPTEEASPGFDTFSLLDELLGVYEQIITRFGQLGVEWVQIDEPVLVEDQSPERLDALRSACARLTAVPGRPKLLVSTYFGTLGESLPVLAESAIEAIGVDLSARGRENSALLEQNGSLLADKRIVAGVVDGRNIWLNDLDDSLETLQRLARVANEVVVSTSCSLLHVPIDKTNEPDIDAEVLSWLAFADQKLAELKILADAANGEDADLQTNRSAIESRRGSRWTTNTAVQTRVAAISSDSHRRATPVAERAVLQQQRLDLPLFPTTTIGSFPQTPEIRKARRDFNAGAIDAATYQQQMRSEIAHVVELQERVGLDVLVHGEPERNDMVQYFAELLDGYVATSNGWVQSYGSRYVRPPIIAGDLSRPNAMTVEWSKYAKSQTTKPMKGMLTGPVTMLCWSFVRDDQPWATTARQMALALRDEVNDLEAAGLGVVQVDEPALREGLPLREAQQGEYLDWATEAFRLTTSGVANTTQIHTHMCYAEFGEIVDAVAALDADVISLEAARSGMAIAEEVANHEYPGAVGPGVYDIHSPRVPSKEEIADLLARAAKVIDAERLWVNPDCGLKTRREEEVVIALKNMVDATRDLRESNGR